MLIYSVGKSIQYAIQEGTNNQKNKIIIMIQTLLIQNIIY